MQHFLSIYTPLFLIGYIVLVFIVPTIRVYKKTGINPFRFNTNHDPAHEYVGAVMKVLIGLLLATVFIYALAPGVYPYLGPLTYLEQTWLQLTGMILVHISLIGAMLAQYQMKLSWRIGIDYENKTALVTSGLFAVSRNPIFLFLLLALAGLFLLLPNAITFAVLFAGYVVVQVTMRMEEVFLEKSHGEAYRLYKGRVRRLI